MRKSSRSAITTKYNYELVSKDGQTPFTTRKLDRIKNKVDQDFINKVISLNLIDEASEEYEDDEIRNLLMKKSVNGIIEI